jgi:hypothetical protein
MRCSTCHEDYTPGVLDGPHKCPTKWLVWNPDQGETSEDAHEVFALGADLAVEMWAEQDDNNSAEYSIAGGTPADVCVQGPSGHIRQYRVSGEYRRVYSAVSVK